MVGEDGKGRSKDRCERAGISAGGVHVLLEAGVSVKEIEKNWMNAWESCKEWVRGGKTKYNKAKTNAMFVELEGRIQPLVVRIHIQYNTVRGVS